MLLAWRQPADEKDLRWVEDIPLDIPRISADPIRLAQVIGNRASNAVKYTPVGGSVVITADADEQEIWVRFKDTGPGISFQEQDLIFEPFYRGEQGRKIKQGMGLGLSISRDILHAHGGEIELDSVPGEGSQFTIWLPRS